MRSLLESGFPERGSAFFVDPAAERLSPATVERQSMKPGLGKRVRTARTAKGWTLGELAAESGISKTMLSRVEAGSRSVTLDSACALADALGISLDALAGRAAGNGPKKSQAAIAKAKRLTAELSAQLSRLE